MTHDKAACEFCQAVATMNEIMEKLETVMTWDVPLFDDAVSDVYNAADNARSILRCWAADRESADEHPPQ
jgi:hypothetical protein